MITAKERWIQFEKKYGRPPEIEEFEEWGYHKRYWYEVRKKIEKEIEKEANCNGKRF